MKKIVLLITLILPLLAIAAERSASEAAAIAAEFMNQQVYAPARRATAAASSYTLAHTRKKLNSEAPAFYVLNNSQQGFVVVSADDRTEDVLMYSEEGKLDVENANSNLKFWLGRLQEEISAVNDENAFTTAEKKIRKATTVTAISPLLGNIAWDQEAPYYNQCPYSSYDSKARCLTGCVATAAAQIMRKWKYPAKGTGSFSYTWYDYKDDNYRTYQTQTITKNFSTVTFDWDNMLETYGKSYTEAQANAVATLMYCCGVACEMCYGSANTTGGSGSWTDDMGYGLNTFFGYKVDRMISNYSSQSAYERDKDAKLKGTAEWNVTNSQFTSYFNTELEAGRPILMGGYGESSGGHEFVCDGRDASGKFHINWGWSGESNCYCLISSLKPSKTSYNFSESIDALLGVEPNVVDTVHVTGVTISPSTLALSLTGKSTLTATVAPSDATVKTVTWSTSDKNVATVSDAGVVTAVGVGSATITATTKEGNKKATCSVTVTKVDVTGITVSPTTLTLKQKEKATVSATIVPADASDKTYTWSSSNTQIATVSDAGQVVGVAQGQAWIIATTKDGGFKDTCFVTVTEDSIEVEDCDKYTYTFTAKCGLGTKTLGKYTWEVACTNSNVFLGSSTNKGAQFGSDKEPAGQLTLTTENTAECLIQRVTVKASIASKGDGKLSIYINGKQVGSQQPLTVTNTEYTFTNTSGEQGNLEIRLTNSAKAMYIQSIEVNPITTDLVEVSDETQPKATKVMLDGQLFILHEGHLYNAQGNVVR